MLAETVAGVSCSTVSMATSWERHLAEGHVAAQPTGQAQQLQLVHDPVRNQQDNDRK